MSLNPQYIYNAHVIRVVDGDTVDVEIDLGFDIRFSTRLRLYGIDTPEKTSTEPSIREKANAATQFLKGLIEGKDVTIQSFKHDKYGRYLANIFVLDSNINQRLIQEGYAAQYFGGHK